MNTEHKEKLLFTIRKTTISTKKRKKERYGGNTHTYTYIDTYT